MSVVGIGIINKRGERRKYLPLEMRMVMYNDVLRLHEERLGYRRIRKIIYEKYKKQISFSRISDWINGKHKPLGNVNKFNNKSSKELMYVVGVMFSDAYKYFNGENYLLRLSVIDKEYAEALGKCLAKVLGKKEPYKPFWDKNQKRWVVGGCSILLYKFLEKPLKELKPYIEYSKETVASFLRAIFDGDGSIHVKIRKGRRKRKLWLCNTNKELLIYVQYLLKKYFNIDTTGPHLARKSGKIFIFPDGKITKTTKDYYYIYIRARSLSNFYKHIGFTIKRKQQRLIKAVK